MYGRCYFKILYSFLSSLIFFSFLSLPAYAVDTTAVQHYITKYGFFQPQASQPIPQVELQRLGAMKPLAIAAAAKYNARYHQDVEPELVLWWSYSEGIGAHINYSNCANQAPATGSYFTDIKNCNDPSFWQLGAFGNQFTFLAYFYGAGVQTNVPVLKNAFTDMHGDPNNAILVQQIGQAVLDFDKTQHTQPPCGGYSCTFPTMTIDQLIAGVQCGAAPCNGNQETQNNWWASVLMRDPAINAYIQSRGMWGFSRNQTMNWPGCYYAAPCWQNESNKLGDLLAVWNSLPACTGSFCTTTSSTTANNPTPTPIQQYDVSPDIWYTFAIIIGLFLMLSIWIW